MDPILSKGVFDVLLLFIWIVVLFIMEVHGPPKAKAMWQLNNTAYSMSALISVSTISSRRLSGYITS